MRIEQQDALHELVMDAWHRTDAARPASASLLWSADGASDAAASLAGRIADLASIATALHLARRTLRIADALEHEV